MKSPTARDARKLGSALRGAGKNARKTGEIAKAAAHVVAKRIALAAAAVVDPRQADHAELARIIPEKARAFSAAGMTWLQWSGEIAGRTARMVASEVTTTTRAASALARCRTPAGVIAMQTRLATAWFARAWSQSLSLGSLAMRSQGAALAPIHRTATANARRLNR